MTASPARKQWHTTEDAQLKADAQHQEAVLVFRVFGVEKSNRILVKKHGLRLFKGDTVFTLVLSALRMIPLEMNISHMYSVRIRYANVKSFLLVKPGEMILNAFLIQPFEFGQAEE
jgi:hypothetical protein